MATNNLPAWARVKQLPLEMVAARDFNPGDTLYFSERAYPRVLWAKLSETTWSVLVQRDGRHERGTISIEPDVRYVIKRATPRAVGARDVVPLVPGTKEEDFFHDRPLRDIRVEGEHLEVGDVVYLDVRRRRAEILEIGPIVSTTFRGPSRQARLDFLDLKKIESYVFSGFNIAPPFVVVSGPKFEAARRDPSQVFWRPGVNRWHWKG